MIRHRLLTLAAVAVAVSACNNDTGGTTTAVVPLAYVRYINAIPDTVAVAFRFVDALENSPSFFNANFRDFQTYQAVSVGKPRHLKVFLDPNCAAVGCSAAVSSTVVWDTTATFTSNTYYTVILTGFKKSGAPAFSGYILTDNVPTPTTAQVALRFFHAAAGIGNVDAYQRTGTAAAPGTIFASNVPYLGSSAYSTLAPAATLKVLVALTGTTTALADVTAPAGAAGTTTTGPVGGSNFGGTAMTAIFVNRSSAATGAPQAYTTPSVVFVVDRRPPTP
ncbi:MAG: DUF4397 domain-containing protein [Gemmatimonadaceae bacterium]